MDSMEMKVANGKLTIICPLSKGKASKSGLSLIVATTGGFIPIPGTDLRLSLNVIKMNR